MKELSIEVLLGQTIISISGKEGDDELLFETSSGKKYKMYHDQDCCESVFLESIDGKLEDLLGTPILQAEESTSSEEATEQSDDSSTWTFYKLATIKGYVTLRWLGTSNGYYSESVDFVEVENG